LRSKMGRWESERLYKGRNPSSWGTPPPTNLQPPEPCFSLPMDLISIGEGSHEAMKEGAKGWRSPMMPAAGKESPAPPPAPLLPRRCRPRPRCSSSPSSPLSPSHIQWFILPHTSVPFYVNMVFDDIIFIL
jgi:hypothetical protein